MQKEQFNVSEENRTRMMRLTQEVIGRLTEMNMIVASTMEKTTNGFTKVQLNLPENGSPVEILFSSDNELVKKGIVTMSCGVYRDPPGRCEPCIPW